MDHIIHGILQARILEWVAISFSKERLYLLSMMAYSPDGTDNPPNGTKIKFKVKTSELQERQWSEVKVAQLYLTLSDPMDYIVHGIL